jgi:hypothetical protein
MRSASSICAALTKRPRHSAAAPAPSAEGVLGIARITAISIPAASSMARVFTDAANEISVLAVVSAGRISSISPGTCIGFTPSRIRSDCRAASRLLVVTSTPHCVLSASARSAWPTVA